MAIAEIRRIEDGPHGRVPADAGWWTLNLREMAWKRVDGGGTWCVFESPVAPSPRSASASTSSSRATRPASTTPRISKRASLCSKASAWRSWRVRNGAWRAGTTCTPRPAPLTSPSEHRMDRAPLLMVGTRAQRDETLYLPDPAAARHGAAVERESASPPTSTPTARRSRRRHARGPSRSPDGPSAAIKRCSPQARVTEMVRAAARMRIPP